MIKRSDKENDILFAEAMERLEESQKGLWETIGNTISYSEYITDQLRAMKIIENELKDLDDKLKGYFSPKDAEDKHEEQEENRAMDEYAEEKEEDETKLQNRFRD